MGAEQIQFVVRGGGPFAAAVVGGVIGVLSARAGRGILAPLVHFAAGAFLGIALLHLLPEAAYLAGWPLTLGTAAVGWGLAALVTRWAGATCPGCAAHGTERRQIHFRWPLVGVVALHSFLDGLPLTGHAPEADMHHSADLLSAAMFLHKLPEGLALAVLARASGLSLSAALGLTVAVEACTLLGAGAGLLLEQAHSSALGLALGLTAGSFLWLVFLTVRDLRGAARPLTNACATAAGTLVVLITRLAGG